MVPRRSCLRGSFALIGALIFSCLFAIAAPGRISGSIDRHRTVMVKGHLNWRVQAPALETWTDRGVLDPWTPIHDVTLLLQPSSDQAAELEQLLEEQRDPSSANYQRWLTPEEFGQRFGLAESDLGQITAWLTSEGFTVEHVARAANWVTFGGTAEQLERTFQTQFHRYENDGEKHFANVTEPSVPAALADVVSGIRGLDDFRPKPQRNPGLRREFNGSSGTHYVAPDDLASIYDISALYKAGFDGTGQKLVIAGQTNIKLADIRAFRSQFNLAAKDPQMVLVGSDPGIRSGDSIEADLDIEWAGAVARNATIIYVYSQNVFTSVQYAIDQNLAPVISLSYGACEVGISASYRTMAQQANAQGITWLSASGDSGAAGCDAQGSKSATRGPGVIFPANIPEVTAVGGTEFNEAGGTYWTAQNTASGASAMSYIPEKAWNDTSTSGISATGGGASTVFTKPWWQSGPGVPNDKARDLPDVSLTASGAHDGYVMYAGGLMVVGGTSASTPSFAGIVSLINQYVVAKGVQAKPGLGNINPMLYSLAQSVPAAFHDVTVGDNIVPCTVGTPGCSSGSFGYKAGVGYDLVTGLGSVDAYKLVTNWASLPSAVGTTTKLTATPASLAPSATVQLSATVTPVTGNNPPTGSVTLSAGNGSLGIATLVLSSGTSSTATLTVNATSLASGSNTISASYTPQGNFAASSGSTTVTVASVPVSTSTTVTANPLSIPSTGTTQVTATVRAATGTSTPAGNVTFSVGSTHLGSAALASGVATMTVNGSRLNSGSNAITASFTATGNFANSTGSVTITVTSATVATTTTVAANPASLAPSGTTQVTATVRAATGTTAPTGNVTFSLAGASLGAVPLANGVASLPVKGSILASGNNTIMATYVATGNFGNSTGSVVVSVTPASVATTMTLTANPTSIAATSSTLLTATVRAASSTSSPTGSVAFLLGTSSLGSASLVNGAASLTVKGTSLATGNNAVSAIYTATGAFANGTASVTVNVTSPPTTTTTTVAATPASIPSTGTTQLVATVKPASGTAALSGTVSFMLGSALLGSMPLAATSEPATATLSVRGNSLVSGANLITATYSGASVFSGSSGTATVTVTAAANSKVVLTVTPKPSSPTVKGWQVGVQLQEQAGVATTITGFTLNGSDFSNLIQPIFGSGQLPARGALSAGLSITGTPLPADVVFGFSGVDASGAKWSQSVSVATASSAGTTGK